MVAMISHKTLSSSFETLTLHFDCRGMGESQKSSYRENLGSTYNLVGARFYDPVLGVWLGRDPAKQYNNPFSALGGDPVNQTDPNGEFACAGICIAAIAIGAAVGTYYGGVAATGSYTWEGFDLSDDWDEVLIGGATGAAIGFGGFAAGAYAGAYATSSLGLNTAGLGGSMVYGGVSSAVAGGLTGVGNAWAFGDAGNGNLFNGSAEQMAKAGASGFLIGGALGAGGAYLRHNPEAVGKGLTRAALNEVDKEAGKQLERLGAREGAKLTFGKFFKHHAPSLHKGLETGASYFAQGLGYTLPVIANNNTGFTDIFSNLGVPSHLLLKWNNFSGNGNYLGSKVEVKFSTPIKDPNRCPDGMSKTDVGCVDQETYFPNTPYPGDLPYNDPLDEFDNATLHF